MEGNHTGIRIYVACSAAYNNGHLHGVWIDADQEPEQIQAEIRTMLHSSPVLDAEEWAIHDYEGFEGAQLLEHEGLDQVAEMAAFISEHGRLGAKLIDHLGDIEEARSALEEHYAGCFAALSEFAEEITEQTTSIPDSLRFYIDYERMAQDLEINDVFIIETGFEEVHVFWNH